MAFYRRHRLDSNHKAIKLAFERCGWAVWDVSQASQDGEADLIIAKAGRTVAVEVKPLKGTLRDSQSRWLESWPGESAIVRSIEDVLALSKWIMAGR